MMNRIAFALLACCFMAIYGCKKENDHTDVTFVNHINKTITLDIYGTKDDYNESKNRLMRKVLQYNEVLVMNKAELPANKTYYADWYDDEHYYSNWYNDADKPDKVFVSFATVPGANTFYLEPDFRGKARSIFLNKTGISTNWKAVNAYIGSRKSSFTSVWNDLAESERIHEITIKKDFTALYSYIGAGGTPTSDPYDFKVHNADAGYIQLINSQNSYLEAGWSPLSTQPEFATTSTDTVMALLPTSDYYFMLVKQK